jgi:hypothetical protein
MPVIACPYCSAHINLAALQKPDAFVCWNCRRDVNTNETLEVASALVGSAVTYGALLIGTLVALGDRAIAAETFSPEQLRLSAEMRRAEMNATFLLFPLAGCFAYVFGRLVYWRLGLAAARFTNPTVAIITFLFFVGALVVLVAGVRTLRNTGIVRPALPLGVLCMGIALWDIWKQFQLMRVLTRTDPEYAHKSRQEDEDPKAPQPVDADAATYSASVTELMNFARYEAGYFGQEFVGTQHLLLACVDLAGRASEVLAGVGVTYEQLRLVLEPQLQRSEVEIPKGLLPLTPAVRRVLELADSAARSCGLERAEAKHLMLALLTDADTMAVDALSDLGVDTEELVKTLAAQTQPG